MNTLHRFIDAGESILYGVGTVVCGGLTIGFATAALGIAITGVGIPIALIPGAIAWGSAGATVYSGSKTIHKLSHVFGGHGKCHSMDHALIVFGK